MNKSAIEEAARRQGISDRELENALFWLRASDSERRPDFKGGAEVIALLLSALSDGWQQP